jgi:hypothetical protein
MREQSVTNIRILCGGSIYLNKDNGLTTLTLYRKRMITSVNVKKKFFKDYIHLMTPSQCSKEWCEYGKNKGISMRKYVFKRELKYIAPWMKYT